MSIRTKLPRAAASMHDRLEVLATELEIELEAEPRQLHRHVRVEPLLVDPRERVVVLAGDRPRLVGARDLLAEHVDGRELALRVQPAARPGRRRRATGLRCNATKAAGRQAWGPPAGARRSRDREGSRAAGWYSNPDRGKLRSRRHEAHPPTHRGGRPGGRPGRRRVRRRRRAQERRPSRRSTVTEKEFHITLSTRQGRRRPGPVRDQEHGQVRPRASRSRARA